MFANIHYDFNSNKIHLWEYENNQRKYIEKNYEPYCYVPSKEGKYKDLFNKKCKIKKFRNYYEQKEYINNYQTFEGDIKPEDRFLIDRYYDKDLLENIPNFHIHITDIETKCDQGFPKAERYDDEITIITTYSTNTKKYHIFTYLDYEHNENSIKESGVSLDDIDFHYVEDEKELLKEYLRFFRSDYPDMISGWHSKGFDYPYILDRCELHFGEKFVSRFSPLGIVKSHYYKDKKEYHIAGITDADYMLLYKEYSENERESYKLDHISHIELGEKKLEYDGSLKHLWKTDPQTYVLYNIKDTKLVLKLHEKFDFIGLIQAQAYLSKVPIDKVSSSIKKFDNYLISLLKSERKVLPTAIRNSKISIPGGFVLEPQRGLTKNVVSFDFTSLYPHIIFSLNISPETYVGKIKSKEGNSFIEMNLEQIDDNEQYSLDLSKNNVIIKGLKLKSFIKEKNLLISANGILFKNKEGLIPKVVREMFDKRKENKDLSKKYEKQYIETKEKKYDYLAKKFDLYQKALKVNCNAIFGILCNEFFRLYNPDLGAAITLTGQMLTKYTKREIDNFFKEKFHIDNEVTLYCDTDSFYVDYSPIVEKLKIEEKDIIVKINKFNKKIIDPFFTKIFDHFSKNMINNEKNWYHLKREAINKSLLLIEKRRYVMLILDMEGITFDEPQVKVKGVEIIRSSTPNFCKEKLKEIVKIILEGQNKNEIIDQLKIIHRNFKDQKLSEIAFPRGLKDLEKYIDKKGKPVKGCPIHVRASINYNDMIRDKELERDYELIQQGEKIKFIYLNKNNILPGQNIVAFPEVLPEELGLNKYIDYETQFEKSFMSPIQKFAESLGWGRLDLNVSDISEFF